MPTPPAYCWTKKGQANRHEVKTRWGKQGRIKLIGTLLSLDGEIELLEYRMLERPYRTGAVLGYLDSLAEEAAGEGSRDGFGQRAVPQGWGGPRRAIGVGGEGVEALRYLPAYCAGT